MEYIKLEFISLILLQIILIPICLVNLIAIFKIIDLLITEHIQASLNLDSSKKTRLNLIINIAKDFTKTPGPGLREQGSHSGQEFREDFLIPKYEEAKRAGEKLNVVLDGVYGCFESFLEEAFGGLQRAFPQDFVINNLNIISKECQYDKKDVYKFIYNAKMEIIGRHDKTTYAFDDIDTGEY